MDIESFREYCLSLKAVEESFPFDEHSLVFKVMGKIFAILSLDKDPASANLKADPEWSLELREEYFQVVPGYHMNKKHWNTITLEGLEDGFVRELIDHSYAKVVEKFSSKLKAELEK